MMTQRPQLSLANLFGQVDAGPDRGRAEDFYARPVEGLEVAGIGPFYTLLLAIWQLRPLDLQKLYPLDTHAGCLGFMAWCVVHGRREYAALREFTPFWESLSQPADIPATHWSGGISRFMQLITAGWLDLGIDPALATEKSQFALLRWFWFSGGYRDLLSVGTDIPVWQKRFLLDQPNLADTRLAQLFYACRPDLQRGYPVSTPAGRERFGHWLKHYGVKDPTFRDVVSALVQPPQAKATCSASFPRLAAGTGGVVGVNLIGYAYGELGIGEDVRMAAYALRAAGIPFTVINFAPGDDIRQADRSIEQWVGEEPIYPINVFCLTALEHLRFFLERGQDVLEGRYNIGYWPWELQNWPANWEHCFALVDEVWASSEHIRQAVARVSPVPVMTMPMAVTLPTVQKTVRADYSLPEEDVLFVFSFDGNSSLARKNPLAVVQAFQEAFPNGDESVGLVIKCMRPDTKNPTWKKIVVAARKDGRVCIVNALLTKPQVLGLYGACDCFISLHRAEGYGRGIAEALLLGLDVIATGYGGNVDFCEPGGAYLVPYELVPVGKGEYVEAGGQYWAEPDVSAAANLMQTVVKKRAATRKRRRNAATLEQLFAPQSIGASYQRRLREINAAMALREQIELSLSVHGNLIGIET